MSPRLAGGGRVAVTQAFRVCNYRMNVNTITTIPNAAMANPIQITALSSLSQDFVRSLRLYTYGKF